jgi:hypothetical protein
VSLRAGMDTEGKGKIICLCRGSNLDLAVVQSGIIVTELPCLEIYYSINITLRSRYILVNMTVAQLLKNFPACYIAKRFVVIRTTVHHRPYPQPDEPNPHPPYFPKMHFNIILSSTHRSSEWSVRIKIINHKSVRILVFPMRAAYPAHLIGLV